MLNFILSPGIQIVSRISIAKKFLLILLLYLIPVGYVAYYAINNHVADLAANSEEIETISLIKAFKPVFTNMDKSRGLTSIYLNGNSGVKQKIITNSEKVDTQLEKISRFPQFALLTNVEKSEFESIRTEWQQLANKKFNMKDDASFLSHSKIVNRVGLLMVSILESSSLFTDPEQKAAFLIKLVVSDFPAISDIIGKTRGIGAGVATKGTFNSDSFIALSNHHKQLEQLRDRIAYDFQKLSHYGEELKRLTDDFGQLDNKLVNFIAVTSDKILDPDSIEIDGNSYFLLGTEVIDHVLKLYDDTYDQLNSILIIREDKLQFELFLNISSSILLVIAAFYLFASVYRNMLDSISRIEACVNAVADGDLSTSVEINSSDEMKNIGDQINKMVEHTRTLVHKVLNTTEELVNSADLNRQSAQTTSEKIDQQNIEVEQVATAMNEMSSTVQEVARNAEQTALSTASADKDSNIGFDTVQNTIKSINELATEITNASTSIDELQNDVNKISSVLDVIQGIADQTNLLALNAAIEAARAGETGRGFAVVADEVRTLASKTQESTEEIRNMINKLQESAHRSVRSMENGNEKSHQTVEESNKAGEALKKISESVGHISLMGEQIAAAATEQSTVAEEINRSIISVKDISELTQQSARDSSDNSKFVDRVSNDLQEIVKHFKV